MPFANSYVEDPHAGENGEDALRCFAALGSLVVRRPLSTFVVRSKSPGGGMRFLFVDRVEVPREGGSVLLATAHGLKEILYDESTPKRNIWGTVVWVLEQM